MPFLLRYNETRFNADDLNKIFYLDSPINLGHPQYLFQKSGFEK